MEYRFKKLVDNEHFCPFNRITYDYLKDAETSRNLIDAIYSLYERVNFQFSSPGNSFPRNVIYELNRPYTYHEPFGGSLSFYASKDVEFKKDYDLYFKGIMAIAEGYKFRLFNQSFIDELKLANQVILTSDLLTEEGMKMTIKTSSNITDELSNKIIYKSVDFWKTFDEESALKYDLDGRLSKG